LKRKEILLYIKYEPRTPIKITFRKKFKPFGVRDLIESIELLEFNFK